MAIQEKIVHTERKQSSLQKLHDLLGVDLENHRVDRQQLGKDLKDVQSARDHALAEIGRRVSAQLTSAGMVQLSQQQLERYRDLYAIEALRSS